MHFFFVSSVILAPSMPRERKRASWGSLGPSWGPRGPEKVTRGYAPRPRGYAESPRRFGIFGSEPLNIQSRRGLMTEDSNGPRGHSNSCLEGTVADYQRCCHYSFYPYYYYSCWYSYYHCFLLLLFCLVIVATRMYLIMYECVSV